MKRKRAKQIVEALEDDFLEKCLARTEAGLQLHHKDFEIVRSIGKRLEKKDPVIDIERNKDKLVRAIPSERLAEVIRANEPTED